MFTGLVEEMGTIARIADTAKGFDMTIRARTVLDGVALGDSISVNGVCLTVASFDAETFTVGLAPETRRKTSLDALGPNASVNLERAALPTTRLGGHYVQGHVDTAGRIKSIRPDGDALWVTINAPPALMKYIVPKGYIAVDGASLTVVNTGADWFDLTLVRYTQDKIVLTQKKPGAPVNLEVDILAKYVESLIAAGDVRGIGPARAGDMASPAQNPIDRAMLERVGMTMKGDA